MAHIYKYNPGDAWYKELWSHFWLCAFRSHSHSNRGVSLGTTSLVPARTRRFGDWGRYSLLNFMLLPLLTDTTMSPFRGNSSIDICINTAHCHIGGDIRERSRELCNGSNCARRGLYRSIPFLDSSIVYLFNSDIRKKKYSFIALPYVHLICFGTDLFCYKNDVGKLCSTSFIYGTIFYAVLFFGSWWRTPANTKIVTGYQLC